MFKCSAHQITQIIEEFDIQVQVYTVIDKENKVTLQTEDLIYNAAETLTAIRKYCLDCDHVVYLPTDGLQIWKRIECQLEDSILKYNAINQLPSNDVMFNRRYKLPEGSRVEITDKLVKVQNKNVILKKQYYSSNSICY